jgi:hypothetical protein
MKIDKKNLVRPIFFLVFILTLFTGLQAQSKKAKHPRWNWEKHQTATINYAKKYLISKLDPKLPETSFEEWFQSEVGETAQIDWEINDCGEQSGTSADRGRDFPMCIEAKTQLADYFYVSVNIQFGMFSHGISKEKPFLRDILVGDEIDGEMFYELGELPKKLSKAKLAFESLDPNNGQFYISGAAPKAFGDDFSIWFKTMDYNPKNKYVAVKKTGGIWFAGHQYQMRKLEFDGQTWSFETAPFRGVSFRFTGHFVQSSSQEGIILMGVDVLRGHLIKLVRGRKSIEADLIFSHAFEWDCR